jgi:hypothetical protein
MDERYYFGEDKSVRFLFPIDGDCLNANDGVLSGDTLTFTARIEAPEGHMVELCGKRAVVENGEAALEVSVIGREAELTVTDLTDGISASVRVFRLKNPIGGYRISSDDNIIFLADITANKDKYTSIFDNPYLAVYKKAHDLYGAKVHINLFYEYNDDSMRLFGIKRGYFNLSMMTDKFKEEFRANSDWLKLSFHSYTEFPDKPYEHATAQKALADAKLVIGEIERFAGREVLSPCTTIHWGEANVEVTKALRGLGYRVFAGYFIPENAVHYYAPDALTAHIYERDFWYDRETDMFFSRIDSIVNCFTNEENLETVRDAIASPTRGGFISIMIHEQYFHEDYTGHLPDFEKRVLDPCRLIYESGYVGRHLYEVDDFPSLVQ